MSELFNEARQLMEKEEMPERVSNKLLWAAVAEVYKEQKRTNGRLTKVESHWTLKVSSKKFWSILIGAVSVLSPIYIKESRDFILGILKLIFGS